MALTFLLRPRRAFTIDYGQSAAAAEITAASIICTHLAIEHEVISIDCSPIGAGNMVRPVGKGSAPAVGVGAPTPEWWPFRNQLLITFAAARAVALGVDELVLGTVNTDGQHRDGTPEFYGLVSDLVRMQEGGVTISAPAITMDSATLIRQSGIPDSLLAWSHSCHRDDLACGICRGCQKRISVLDRLSGR